MTSRRLALLELVLVVVPVTLFWLLVSPGLVILMAKVPWIETSHRGASAGSLHLAWGAYAFLLIVAGLIGLVSLWTAVLRSIRSVAGGAIPFIELMGLTVGALAALPVALSLIGAKIPASWRVVAGAAVIVATRHALSWSRSSRPKEAA